MEVMVKVTMKIICNCDEHTRNIKRIYEEYMIVTAVVETNYKREQILEVVEKSSSKNYFLQQYEKTLPCHRGRAFHALIFFF